MKSYEIRIHGPYVDHWYELENQDEYPAKGLPWERFFRNQSTLTHVRVQKDLAAAQADFEALVLAVPHTPYLDLSPDEVVLRARGPIAVVDCLGILDDERIQRFFELGCEVNGLGRGHVQRTKEAARKARGEALDLPFSTSYPNANPAQTVMNA